MKGKKKHKGRKLVKFGYLKCFFPQLVYCSCSPDVSSLSERKSFKQQIHIWDESYNKIEFDRFNRKISAKTFLARSLKKKKVP